MVAESSDIWLSKSQNKHNTLYLMTDAIESGEITAKDNQKVRGRKMADECKW